MIVCGCECKCECASGKVSACVGDKFICFAVQSVALSLYAFASVGV